MKSIYILFLLELAWFNSNAAEWTNLSTKDFISDMQVITLRLSNSKSFSVNVSYASYEKENEEIIHDQSNGYVKKAGNNYHSFAMGIHSIQNTTERVLVDNGNEIISVTNPVTSQEQYITPELSERVLKLAISISKKSEGDNVYYSIKFSDKYPISSYLIRVDQKKFMKQIDIVYQEKLKNNKGEDANLRLRIKFSQWSLNESIPNSEFLASQYVIFRNGRYELTTQYSNYELSDQRVTN